MHPTYKHLEDRIRLAGLTLGQWAQLFACVLAAYALSRALPLPGSWSLSVAVTVCGLPAAGAMASQAGEFDVGRWMRAAIGYAREPRRYVAVGEGWLSGGGGPGAQASADGRLGLDAEALWD